MAMTIADLMIMQKHPELMEVALECKRTSE